MGISGLLPLLAPIQKQVHLRELAGLTVAVDTYVWLHRGAFGCAMDLGLNKPTTAYIGFCMKRVALLKQFGIKPLLVFDGGCLPMKHHTEHGRRMRRKEAREKALEELSKGNAAKATEMFQQCVDITPNMAWELMKVLKKQGIEFIVAPYEADAQLVYLEKIKKVHAVLTEDSDLLVFGCQRLLLKLDAIGNAVEIRAKDFPHVPCMKRGWTFSKFRQACILSGCDYLPSLKGVGIKKAFDAMSHSSDAEKLLRMWRNFGYSMKAPPFRANYDSDFKQAELTFLYQRVYDPNLKKLVPLNEPTAEVGNLAEMSGFLGP
ncbi:PIN domain-like protein [Obelidium mucronatum]|nr:PIN domain-like protein [Obelidium mucronatum]